MTLPERLSDAELVRKHQAGVWRYLRFLGCDEARADDLTQETFLAVLKGSFQQRGEAETAAYLRTVARSRFLMAPPHPRSAAPLRRKEIGEMNDQREYYEDRLMDIALREKVGGHQPPDLSEQILSSAQRQPRPAVGHQTNGRHSLINSIPYGDSLCLLALAALAGVLWQPELSSNLEPVALKKASAVQLADLVHQFNLLMDEQRYDEAEIVAKHAHDLAAGSDKEIVQTMLWKSHFARQLTESTVPLDDSQSMDYPDAKDWPDWERDR
jgi:hypothetical protein